MKTRETDKLILGGREFTSRFILGSGKYSLELIKAAVEQAGAQIITLALRRANPGGAANILDYIPEGVTLLPNTSGARNAGEAVRIARLAREVGCGDFVKLEIIRDSKYLLPDNAETIRATEILAKEGFLVMPYMYPDLNAARDLADAGAVSVMPLGAPIGSNKGLCTREFIRILIDEIDLPVIVDAGIGRPSQACDGQHGYRHGKPDSSDGGGVWESNRGRAQRLSGRAGPRFGSGCVPFLPADRLLAGRGREGVRRAADQ